MQEKRCLELNELNTPINEPEDDQKINSNSLESNETLDEEKTKLISSKDKKSKEELVKFFNDINKNIISNENKNFDDIYREYLNINGFISNKEIKNCLHGKKCCLNFIFKGIFPFLVIINLIGIFQIISIMKILYSFIYNSGKCFLISSKSCRKEEEVYSFFNFFYKELLNEEVDYNLMFFFGFLGNILLGCIGFCFSSIIFGIINVAVFFMIYNFNFSGYNEKTKRYNIFQILYLLIMYILLLVGVGSSSLLSQQILIDTFYKYELIKNNNNNNANKKRKDLDFFFIVCLTTILGYFFKYLLNIWLGYLLNAYTNKKLFFLFCYVIYFVSISLSLLIYIISVFFFFDKIKKEQKSPKKVCKLFGYLIYYEDKHVEKDYTFKTFKCECCVLCCDTIDTCCNESICDLICCQSEAENEEEEKEEKIKCCFKSFCPCCPKEIKRDYYDEPKNVSLLYCYKETRRFKWFYDFINKKGQIELTRIMFNYFLLKLITIAFEKIYNEKQMELKKKETNIDNLLDLKRLLISSLAYIIIIFIFFYITISWGRFIKDSLKEIEQDEKKLEKDKDYGLNQEEYDKRKKNLKNEKMNC